MSFTKKDQFDNKLAKLKESVKNKPNLELLVRHDAHLVMKNHSDAGRLQYLNILCDFFGNLNKY